MSPLPVLVKVFPVVVVLTAVFLVTDLIVNDPLAPGAGEGTDSGSSGRTGSRH